VAIDWAWDKCTQEKLILNKRKPMSAGRLSQQ
jgi:hypothetical protein